MVTKIRSLSIKEWALALVAAFVSGGSAAVVQVMGLTVMDLINLSDLPMFLKMVGTLFVTNGLLSLFMYLKTSPIPPLKTDPGTTEIPRVP